MGKYTHLDCNEEDLGDQGHHVRVVLTTLEGWLAHELLKDGEEVIHERVQVLPLGANRMFKCAEDGFERAQGGRLVPLVALREALSDLLGGILGPAGEVELRDVVDDVLYATDNDLACRVSQMHNIIECAKNLRLQHLPIWLADSILTILLVEGAHVLLVLHAEWLLAV